LPPVKGNDRLTRKQYQLLLVVSGRYVITLTISSTGISCHILISCLYPRAIALDVSIDNYKHSSNINRSKKGHYFLYKELGEWPRPWKGQLRL